MWRFLAQALKIGGQMALGYFANDLANAAGQVTGVKTNSNTGKYPWWFLLVILGVAGAGLYYVVDMLFPMKRKR